MVSVAVTRGSEILGVYTNNIVRLLNPAILTGCGLRAAADSLMEEEIVEDFKWLRRCWKDT
jgi:hypothetical protein